MVFWVSARARRFGIGLLLGLSLLAVAAPLAADEDGYRVLLRRALSQYEHGNYPEARALFRRAHEQNPNARTLRGMGLTAYQERRYVLAITLLQQALDDQRKPLTRRMRTQVQDILQEARSFVSKVDVALEPPGAQLEVDGKAVELGEDGTLQLDPGEHELVIRAPGHQQQIRRVVAEAGTQTELRLKLMVTRPTPAPQPPQPAVAATEPAADPDGGGRVYTWVALGSAVVFAGGAAAFWGLGSGELDDVERACRDRGGCTAAEADARLSDSSLDTYETLTSVSLGLSVLAAVTAGTLWFVEGGETDRTSTALRLGVTPGGAVLEGGF